MVVRAQRGRVLLTTPILGIMYYFLPKAAEPSGLFYRLSIVHFWALIFMYIWAGPHHLLYTALPDWAQSMEWCFRHDAVGTVVGGMNETDFDAAWSMGNVCGDPVIKFFIAGVTFYGMATFEGPLLSIKSVSGLAHYTDWIVGHAHTGALGWNGFMAAGMFYYLVPKLWNRPLHSRSLADLHFWTATVGILLYTISMWIAPCDPRSYVESGRIPKARFCTRSFVETLLAIRPMYLTRMVGGLLYITGFVLMIVNPTGR